MNTSSLIKRAVASAVGVYVYVALLAFCMNNVSKFAPDRPGWMIGSLMLTIFVISASITGSLVLLKPAMLYMDGHKKAALQLFAYTVASLAAIALLVGLGLLLMR